MNDVAIKIENVGKLYRIGSAIDQNKTLREALTDMVAEPFRRIRNAFLPSVSNDVNQSDYIWALKNVTFDVKRGEVVGIIGRNGAGKSTILKILSRITEPTEGRVRLYGRIGSLLEVGSGFHSELTGEENIYLSGTILGMNSNEISRKFDEIVAFAGVERFIHTPVKYYSSGMYMRLAFAVAAHLDTEILLIDEVLAVGDATFQIKCLAKMGDITREGHTALFVSHNMAAVGSICRQCIVLEQGKLLFSGSTQEAIRFYETELFQKKYLIQSVPERKDRTGNGEVKLISFNIEDEFAQRIENITNGHDVSLVFGFQTLHENGAEKVDLHIIIENANGGRVFQFGTRFTGQMFRHIPFKGFIVCNIKRFPLVAGRYKIGVYLAAKEEPSDYIPSLTFIDVVDGDFYGSGYQVYENESRILVDGTWSLHSSDK